MTDQTKEQPTITPEKVRYIVAEFSKIEWQDPGYKEIFRELLGIAQAYLDKCEECDDLRAENQRATTHIEIVKDMANTEVHGWYAEKLRALAEWARKEAPPEICNIIFGFLANGSRSPHYKENYQYVVASQRHALEKSEKELLEAKEENERLQAIINDKHEEAERSQLWADKNKDLCAEIVRLREKNQHLQAIIDKHLEEVK